MVVFCFFEFDFDPAFTPDDPADDDNDADVDDVPEQCRSKFRLIKNFSIFLIDPLHDQ